MGRRVIALFGLVLATLGMADQTARAQTSPQRLAALGVPTVGFVEMVTNKPAASEPAPLNIPISPNTSMPRLEQPQGGQNIALAQLAIESSEYMDPRYIANSSHPDDMGFWEHMRTGNGEQCHRLVEDYKNFYLSWNLLYVGAAVAVAAPIANTHADQGIRDWYQRQAGQSSGANSTADVFKQFGEWKYALPVYFALSISEHIFPDSPAFGTIGEFGNRSLRALAVGAPTVGVLQIGLGSGRPYTNDSHWHPFEHSNGVSGHAFVGAVPFLTAASMTDSVILKGLLVAGSFGPAWSRIQHDDHYFSQVLLGWAIAYLSVESVNLTEAQARHVRIVPVDLPQGVGLGVQIDY